MSFSDTLNELMDRYSVTAKRLAEQTNLSAATISRYRTGKREPQPDSGELRNLAHGIAVCSMINGGSLETDSVSRIEADIYKGMKSSLKAPDVDFDGMIVKLNLLISELGVNVSDMSRYLNFDASYLSKIRSGQRKPSDMAGFLNGISQFIAIHYGEKNTTTLKVLMDCQDSEVSNMELCKQTLRRWLSRENVISQESGIQVFLKELNHFDINEYMRAVHFDDLKLPEAAAIWNEVKEYKGIEGNKAAELDWLMATVLSEATDPVFMYSDMPMEEMAKDLEFSKKYMMGMALMLKKGLHLNMIHNMDRPFYELMLGLESFIPLYMTGKVLPYYFKNMRDSIFHHQLWVSGGASLSGEAVTGHHDTARFYVKKDSGRELCERKRSEELLAKASPLMDIYRSDKAHYFQNLLWEKHEKRASVHRNILSVPPIYSLSPELLNQILANNELEEDTVSQIIGFAERYRQWFMDRVSTGIVIDEFPILTKEEFSLYPALLSVSELFYEEDIVYTYEEYKEHILQTLAYAQRYKNYQACITQSHPFRNIQIHILEGAHVIISKNKSPAIQFVIRHPKLRQAIEHMIVPIVEM